MEVVVVHLWRVMLIIRMQNVKIAYKRLTRNRVPIAARRCCVVENHCRANIKIKKKQYARIERRGLCSTLDARRSTRVELMYPLLYTVP